jgi:superfamily II DNA helicase RecQ
LNKENILKSFSVECGAIRLLIATIAFGMGVDCKGVKRVIHFGPLKNIESYAQETGRAGRDGSQSIVFLLYIGMLLSHVEGNIKSYIKSDKCRRDTLLKHFQANFNTVFPSHLCCDICAGKCDCGLPNCQQFAFYPVGVTKSQCYVPQKCRQVSKQQKELVHKKLIIYHKHLTTKLLHTSGNENMKILTDIYFIIGFSEIQIQQVLDSLQHLFDLDDVCNFIEIWDKKHAYKILQISGIVFEDLDFDICPEELELFEMDDT